MKLHSVPAALAAGMFAACCAVPGANAAIPAAHVYHNHMPNFWPFYAVNVGQAYNATATGAPKMNPRASMPTTLVMPRSA